MRRRPSWTQKKTGHTFRKTEGVPFGPGLARGPSLDDGQKKVITREQQRQAIAKDIASIDDNIPPHIRQAFKAHCRFDIEFKVLMRFARHCERQKLTNAEVAKAFADIKTEHDADKFRVLWGQS